MRSTLWKVLFSTEDYVLVLAAHFFPAFFYTAVCADTYLTV